MYRDFTEFDFRYDSGIALNAKDNMRRDDALKGIEGKYVTYRRINETTLA
jgi:hypothetical protein